MSTSTVRSTSLLPVAFILGFAIGCSDTDAPSPPGADDSAGSDGTTSGATKGAVSTTAGLTSGGPTSGGLTTAGLTSGGPTNGGPTNAGPTGFGPTSLGPTSGGPTSGGPTSGGPTSGGPTSGGPTSGGPTSGGPTSGASMMGAGGMGGATSGGPTTGAQASSTNGGTTQPDCNAEMPAGGEDHSGNSRGGTDNLAWEIWSNSGNGDLTTFPGVAAFRASWSEDGGYLGRMGFEWGNNGPPHTAHGRIHAQFVARKDGGGGVYSYVGMYGWTTDPCVEWYVIEDTFNSLPFNPGGTVDKGDIEVDGGTYKVYTRDTTGTGGSRCSGVSNWIQYYSIRTSARDCGVISLTDHFEAWESKGMSMAGNLLEAKILAEVGGDTGSVDFPIANVTTTE